MRSKLRPRLTFANVTSVIALFFAVGGGGFALASHLRVLSSDIVDGQVTNPDLAQQAVNTGKIKDGAVGNADLAPSSVGTGKVGDASLLAADFAGGQLPRGAFEFYVHVPDGTANHNLVPPVNGIRLGGSCYAGVGVSFETLSGGGTSLTLSGIQTDDGVLANDHDSGISFRAYYADTTQDYDGLVRGPGGKWTHFDVGRYNGGTGGCNFWGLVTPPSN
jgi:hypothetical protein